MTYCRISTVPKVSPEKEKIPENWDNFGAADGT